MAFDPVKEGATKVFDPLAEGAVAVDTRPERDANVVDFTVNQSFDVAEKERFNQIDFTNDVMSMPADVNFVEDPADIDVTEETIATAEKADDPFQDPIKFKEALKDKAGRPLELLPFVGELYSIDRVGRVFEAAKRIQERPNPPSTANPFLAGATPEQLATAQVEWMRDRYIVAEWLTELEERQNRGVSIGGAIAEGILELPSFMVEFLATGGIFETVKQSTKKTIGTVLKRAGAKVSKEFAEKVSTQTGIKLLTTTAGVLAGTAARTGAQFTRVLESSFQRQFPDIKITKKGEVVFQEAQDTPFTAIAKGIGDVFIENISEISGPAITKAGSAVLKRIPFLGKLDDALKSLWLSQNPNKTAVDFVKEIGTRVGYNGFIAELGEEQLGKALRVATGVETIGERIEGESDAEFVARLAKEFGSGLLVEAGVLSVPAGVSAVGEVVAGRVDQKGAADVTVGEIRDLKGESTEVQTKAFQVQQREAIDRTSVNAESETENRVAIVKNMSPEAQKKIGDESIEKVKSRISFKKPKIPIRDRLQDLIVKTDRAFRDEFAGLRKVVNSADAGKLDPADDPVQLAVAFTQKSSAKTRGFVLESTTDLAGNRKSKGLKQIFKPIIDKGGKKNFQDFVTYLVAARDLNLQARGKETGIDPVAARLAFDSLDSPEFVQAAREVTEWNQKGIDLLVESGRISRDSGEAIKIANPIYAPFFREFGEKEVTVTGKGKKFKPKRLKGSKRRIVDPIEGMIQQMDATIQSAQRAAIERSIANIADDNPEALEDFIKPIKAPVKPTTLTADEIKDQLEDIGIDFTGVAEEDLEEMITIFRPSGAIPPGVVTLDVDGKKKFFRVQQDLLDILDGTDIYKLGPFWDFVVGRPTRALKLGATGINASFGLIRNPIRDIQTFTVTSEFAKGGPFSAVAGILKDVKTKASGIAENFGFEGIKPDSDVGKFAALGGEMSGFISQDRQGTKHIQHDMLASNGVRYTINTFAHPMDAMRSLIGITEIGTRVGEFSAALKEGEQLYGKGSLSASVFALNAAQDVTTNFTRHGQIGKQINQVIPFFNAAIQGPDKIVRSFIDRPLKSTVAAVSTLTIPAVFFWWRNKDKPWYLNQTAHEKANYIQFESPKDEDVIFRFPVAFELGHIFQAVPVAFLDAVYKVDPKEIGKILGATLKTANPLDWPSLIGPVVDIKSNENFAGRPIVSRANEGKLPKDQFGPQTSKLMKVIGKQLNMSPSQIEHLASSYSGGLYNRVARMLKNGDMEKQPADIPVLGTLFVRDPFAPKRQVQEFYEERKLLNQKFQSKDITLKESLRRIVVNNLASVLTVSFNQLQDAKTIDERKSVWSDIGQIINFVNDIAPEGK